MSDWVKCTDRLPERYEYVLVYAKMPGTNEPCPISIARHEGEKWNMLSHESECNAVACGDLTWYMEEEEITHWLPLPSIPKD